jgi:hypothetical protein
MPGEARFIQVFFTREKMDDVRRLCANAGDLLVVYHHLPNGEAVAIRSWAHDYEQPDLIMEASHGAPRDLVLPSRFEIGVSRPVGITIYSQPNELRCIELSGYWVSAGEGRRRFPMADTYSRLVILNQQGT